MKSKQPRPYPAAARLLTEFGTRLRQARLRRRFSVDTVCARAGLSRSTLYRVEQGDPSVALGAYIRVLQVLQLETDIARVALDDALGQKLQDLKLPVLRRATRTAKSKASPTPMPTDGS